MSDYNAGMIYYVEDDANIRELTLYALKNAGLETRGFECAEDFYEACENVAPDLILLDVMLPGDDGYDILTKVRSSADTRTIPVMMLTAKGEEYDKVHGLESGADDYLAKPFGMMELVARVRALLRRAGVDGSAAKNLKAADGAEAGLTDADDAEAEIIECGAISLNLGTHAVEVSGVPVELTPKEFDMLALLMSHPERVYTRDKLMEKVWGMPAFGITRTVDVHIQTLRQKLNSASERADGADISAGEGESGASEERAGEIRAGDQIKTVRGVGYRIVSE